MPSPSDPRELAIVQDIQTALRAAVAGSTYHYTLASAAVKLDPNHAAEELDSPSGPRPYALIEIGDLTHEFRDARAGEVQVALPLTIHWYHDTDPTDDASLLSTFFKGCADVETALTQDITRGGRAVDTRVTGRALGLAASGARVWAGIDVEVSIWRAYGTPNG